MEIAIRLFVAILSGVVRKCWYIVLIPVAISLVHGIYTGTWYIFTGIIASAVLATAITTIIYLNLNNG